MRSLFVAASVPVLSLLLPEMLRDAFDWLRAAPYWPWIQLGCFLWLGGVAIVATWGWFARHRGEKIAVTFIPGELPYEELQHGVNRLMTVLGGYGAASSVEQQWFQKVYRVRIENLTSDTLENVALHLDRFDPPIPMLNDMPLHQMHDNPAHETQFRRTFTLPPKGHKDIDVVLKNSLQESAALFHIVFNIGQRIAPGRHEVILRAFGQNVEPRYWRFVVVLNTKGELDFRSASGDRLVRSSGERQSDQA